MTTPIAAAIRPPMRTAGRTGHPCSVASCADGQRADAGEGDLAEPEHAALAGDQRVAEEDHAPARRP